MTGFESSHARATCACGMSRAAVDDPSVRLLGFPKKPLVRIVGLGADARVVPIPGQPPACLRAPRNDADSFDGAEWQHLPLLLAVEKVHQVLHADKARPAVAFGNSKGTRELPRMHRRRADIADLPGLDDVVQRLEGLLDRCAVIPAVDLIEIKVG